MNIEASKVDELLQPIGLERTDAPRLRYGPGPTLAAVGLSQLGVVLIAGVGSLMGVPLGVWRPAVVVPVAVVAATLLSVCFLAPGWTLHQAIDWPRRPRKALSLLFVSFVLVQLLAGVLALLTIAVSEVFSLGWQARPPDSSAFIAGRPAILDVISWLYEHVGAPWGEELLFRLLVLRALLATRLSPAAAIVVTAALFALSHAPLGAEAGPVALAGYFGFGVATGALTWWTGRLAPALFAHVAFNVVVSASHAWLP
jgi:membrane protease YdiL (CAAX protease family)